MSALGVDTLGSKSIAIGTGALSTQNFTSATDTYNVAVGHSAGNLLTTGISNTLIGALAGDAITTASKTTMVGYNAGTGITTGGDNTFVGADVGVNVTTGNANILVGSSEVGVAGGTGEALTTGAKNVIMGTAAGKTATTGNANVYIGYLSASHSTLTTTGSENTLVGSYTDTTAVGTSSANGFGHDIAAEASYTTLGVGANDIRAAHGNTTWSTVSDERYKKDIVDSTAGLLFINALKPRTFKYKNLGELPETFRAYKADSTDVFKNSNTNHGFIAQEVKTAIDADSSIKDGFKLWDDREDGSQEVAETALIPVLTKAVQELSTKLDAALARIATLEG